MSTKHATDPSLNLLEQKKTNCGFGSEIADPFRSSPVLPAITSAIKVLYRSSNSLMRISCPNNNWVRMQNAGNRIRLGALMTTPSLKPPDSGLCKSSVRITQCVGTILISEIPSRRIKHRLTSTTHATFSCQVLANRNRGRGFFNGNPLRSLSDLPTNISCINSRYRGSNNRRLISSPIDVGQNIEKTGRRMGLWFSNTCRKTSFAGGLDFRISCCCCCLITQSHALGIS
mmetsp:Transcript_28926/g.52341  ORF Transcript_28926/g.52341 Transcript_28926/m.52341 type:complete len:230 (-) Transcript_28926:641-1330(-)